MMKKPRDKNAAACVVQSAFRGRQGRRYVSLRRVAALMSGNTYTDSDEEAEVEGAVAQHLRSALQRRSTHRPSLALKAKASAAGLKFGSSKTDVAATPEVPAELSSPGRGSPGAATPRLGGLRIVPLSAPPERASTTTTEPATKRVIDAAFLTWNVNGNAVSREDARAWAMAAGPADAYFVAIQELIDIEAKEGLPDRAVRRRASWAMHRAHCTAHCATPCATPCVWHCVWHCVCSRDCSLLSRLRDCSLLGTLRCVCSRDCLLRAYPLAASPGARGELSQGVGRHRGHHGRGEGQG